MSLFRSPLALIAASGLVCVAPAAAQMVVDIPLAVGFPAPGLPSATVMSLRTPTTNDYSIKAMVGTVAGPGINTSNNMLLWRVGTVAELVARTGGSIAGLPSGVTLSSIETPTVNNLGTIVFTGTLQGPGVNAWNNRAIFSGRPRSLRVIARTGDAAPEQPAGTLFFTFDAPRLSDTDKVIFSSTVTGAGTNLGTNQLVCYGDASQLRALARTGGNVPGIPGARFAILGDPVISPTGTAAFTGVLTNFVGGVDSSNDVGLWTGVPDAMVLKQRAGAGVPAITFPGSIDTMSPASINEDSEIGYTAFLNPRLPNNYPNTLLLIERAGGTVAIAQSTQQVAPGVEIGAIGTPRMSGQENVAFISTLYGSAVGSSDDTAVFMKLAGELSMLAREGQQAAECPAGVRYGSFLGVIVNRNGRVCFVASLVGPGVDASNDRALFAWDRLKGIDMVVRSGSSAFLSPTDTRTVGTISVVMDSGNQDGKPTSLGDDGVLIFQIQFTDGSTAVAARNINRKLADIVDGGGLSPADGTVDGSDFIAFMNAFAVGDTTADIVNSTGEEPPDGTVDGSDLIAFINSFASDM